ncbi:MAG: DedA family protein [Gammaproteobacteria bacterium]|nr:MAG: DedA family protein [Gammaproteobacteria bacterium]
MRLFTKLYDKALNWAAHRHAPYYLGGLSFAESSFFPIPPDVMLAPMSLAKPAKAWEFALITTITSVLGGLFGYLIGYFAFELIEPYIVQFGYMAGIEKAQQWFNEWGFWVVLIAGFSPIPYKVFTIAAGTLSLFLPVFAIASLIGRGSRFFIVAGLIVWGGERLARHLRQYVELIGWLTVAVLVIAILLW